MEILNEENIKQTIFKIFGKIAPEIDSATIEATEELNEEFEIDSMDFLKVVVQLDEIYGIEIPESDYGEISTLEKMVAYIQQKTK